MSGIAGRLAAALADRYCLERELGQGGMATVYLAADLKHDRKVAIKVLRPELAAVLGAERFVQEIKTTAALSHPHILPLFDSGEAGGFLYYVMPYIQGETIREKLNRETQFGVDEAVRITTEVADALDYAHRHGVIHRDIKPENILLHDGRAMVMDFGIALAVSAAAGGRMTETGLSLGTPHYMSPEQATADKQITARSDIYSLASVLYEMLAGHPPHTGSSAQQIIMKIIAEAAAPVSEFRKSVPEQIALAVAKALEKVPADRFATAAEFAAAIQGHLALGGTTHPRGAATSRRREAIFGAVAVASLGLALWARAAHRAGAHSAERVEFAFRLGRGMPDRPAIAISPDGRRIAAIARDSVEAQQVAVRELGSMKVTFLAGTDGAAGPAFSPDGRWLLYVSSRRLLVMPSDGGQPTELADSVPGSAGAWIDDERFLFTRLYDGLFQGSRNGGPATRLTVLDSTRREFVHWYPQILPGGKVAIFNNFSTPQANSRIEAVNLASGRRTVLVEGAIMGRYARSGHLLFVRDGTLFAARFDAKRLRVSGAAVPVIQDVAWAMTDGVAGFDVSENGTLVYLKGSEWNMGRRLVWVDRAGKERPALEEEGQWAEPRLSPDGRWIAVTRLEEGRQVWLYDRNRRLLSRLSRTAGVTFNAVWMPDSRAVVASVETPTYDLWRLAIDGSQQDTLVASKVDKFATSVSQDASTLLFFSAASGDQIETVPLDGDPTARAWEGPVQRRNAVFSPDGRRVAFEERTPDGGFEIVVTAAGGDGTAGRRQVSAGGGTEPRWTKGGRELVYRNKDAVMAAPFDPATGEAGTPVRLFSKADEGRLGTDRTVGYDVTPDGSQFLMVIPVERREALPVVVITNWLQELERKVPR